MGVKIENLRLIPVTENNGLKTLFNLKMLTAPLCEDVGTGTAPAVSGSACVR